MAAKHLVTAPGWSFATAFAAAFWNSRRTSLASLLGTLECCTIRTSVYVLIMKTGKETKLAVTFYRQRLSHCLVAFLFLIGVAVLRAEERLTAVWSSHLAELNQRVPAGFVVVVQPPFVVIGDEAPRMVWSRATNTVKWAVEGSSDAIVAF